MYKKKHGKLCRQWFWPSKRVGGRQQTCGRPECQRERHRRNCADWHRRNPNYDREERVRSRLKRGSVEVAVGVGADPLRRIDEDAARDLVGMEVYVFVEEISRLLLSSLRDSVVQQPVVTKEEISRVGNDVPRAEIGESGPSP
jgi:hypothetical protein